MTRERPLTQLEINVLMQLKVVEKNGAELVAGSGGVLIKKSVYALLGRMEGKGLIVGREVPTPKGLRGPPRRLYSASECGGKRYDTYYRVESWLGVLERTT